MYGSNGRKVLELKDEEILGSVCSLNVIGSSVILHKHIKASIKTGTHNKIL
jgi:hypothetical protein